MTTTYDNFFLGLWYTLADHPDLQPLRHLCRAKISAHNAWLEAGGCLPCRGMARVEVNGVWQRCAGERHTLVGIDPLLSVGEILRLGLINVHCYVPYAKYTQPPATHLLAFDYRYDTDVVRDQDGRSFMIMMRSQPSRIPLRVTKFSGFLPSFARARVERLVVGSKVFNQPQFGDGDWGTLASDEQAVLTVVSDDYFGGVFTLTAVAQ